VIYACDFKFTDGKRDVAIYMGELISVIVPIYRVEKYVEQCIQSICNQTYRNLEIILVDDGSDDECPQICDRYAQRDERIKVIHKENGGLDSARKVGILAATGKYIGYVDGDDWIEPEMYEKLLESIYKFDVEIVESGVLDSYVHGEKKRTPCLPEGCYKGREFTEKVEPKLLFVGNFFEYGIAPYLVSKLFLKDILVKYQMKEGMTNVLHDDTMVSLPAIAESKKLYISHECYYHYRARMDSLKRECRPDEIKNLIECYPDFYARFKGSTLCDEKDRQIQYYAMYWLVFKAPYAFDEQDSNTFLMQFGGLRVDAKIVLYGAGAVGIHMENYIRKVEGSIIVCWADRNYQDLQRTLDVRNPKEIISLEYDYVIISIMREGAVKSAKKDLIALGVPEEKILWIKQEYIDNPELLLSRVEYQGKKLL